MKTTSRETIEWCNFRWEEAPDLTLPRVLLIGDSIANSYHQAVVRELKGIANVDLMATSKAIDDPALLREIAYVMDGYDHRIIHVNNGLHGWHLTTEEYGIGVAALLANLRQLRPSSQLIWAMSTPVTVRDEPARLCMDKNPMVLQRNAVAGQRISEVGIPVNDLYAAAVNQDSWRSLDGYHYNETGQRALGRLVAESLRRAL